ncbi:MAG: UDP-N-acetyl-D-glucosamine dehydrogenase [Omnitrophica bacterium RIFCSPLOWO2_01_FULL_45_10]|nr:MAG: UDP-N-acetyl-D-glucosamine dehydrogenase [Omnitrophica bacterium RIFCSPLOWO2_01_FULL_45_10]
MEKLKVGVVGTGYLGSLHAKIYSKLDNVKFVAVSDCNLERAFEVGKKYRAASYSDYEDLFGRVDAVSIAVPTSLHYNIAKDFLNHDVHVLIEKPITKTLSEADELIEIARYRKLTLQVGHIERFNSAVMAIETYLKKPRFIECQRLGPFSKRVKDVGVVLDLMIHDIDIVLGLIKRDVVNTEAVGLSAISDYEDVANVRLTFDDGAIADITASRVTKDVVRKIRIFQEDSYISLDYLNQEAAVFRKTENRIAKERIKIKKKEPLKKELKSFIECARTGKRPIVSGIEGRRALQVALDIIEKIKPTRHE